MIPANVTLLQGHRDTPASKQAALTLLAVKGKDGDRGTQDQSVRGWWQSTPHQIWASVKAFFMGKYSKKQDFTLRWRLPRNVRMEKLAPW